MPLFSFNTISESAILGIWKIEEASDFLLKEIKLTSSEKNVYNSFKNESRRAQWLSCRVLVNMFMNENGLKGSIYYNENGKPFLTTGHYISISHTKYFSTIIISTSKIVGVDIEKISERILKIKERMASEEELKVAGNDLLCLYTLWGAKEAIYKSYGFKDLDFKNEIFIDLTGNRNNYFRVKVSYKKINVEYIIKRIFVEDHILIYLIDK